MARLLVWVHTYCQCSGVANQPEALSSSHIKCVFLVIPCRCIPLVHHVHPPTQLSPHLCVTLYFSRRRVHKYHSERVHDSSINVHILCKVIIQ